MQQHGSNLTGYLVQEVKSGEM